MKGGCIYTHNGREYWLVCTADAYFDILAAYGGDFGEKILAAGRDGFDCAIGCLCILAREGELCRRYMGYEPLDMMNEEEIRRVTLVGDIGKIQACVLSAIEAGMRIEKEADEKNAGPVDVGLLKFEKKTEISLKV